MHYKIIHPKTQADNIIKALTLVCALCIGIILIAICISLIKQSIPAMHAFGGSFILSDQWNPPANIFGAFAAITGTLITSLISLIISIPLSYGIAISITHILPKKISAVLLRLVELMSGIPSIIYGMWGLFIFGPFLMTYFEQPIFQALQHSSYATYIIGIYPFSSSILTASIVLGIMIVPIMSMIMIDSINSVSPLLIEAGHGLGITKSQVIRSIIIPKVKGGIYGAITIALGRALGETMAVTLVIGNAHKAFSGLFMPGTTIAATIANEFSEASPLGDSVYQSSLMYLALVLFIMTYIVLWFSRKIKLKAKKKHG